VERSLIQVAGKFYDPPINITVSQPLRKSAPYKTKNTENSRELAASWILLANSRNEPFGT